MEELLRKLEISSNQSAEAIAEALGAKQMEYLERLDNVEDEVRREQLQVELKQIEQAIAEVSNGVWQGVTGIKRDVERTESLEDLKNQEIEDKEQLQADSSDDEDWELYQAAYQAFEVDNHAGFPELLQLAEKDNMYAQYTIGHCYRDGSGVAEDEGKAFEWWLKAAEAGNIQAQQNIANAYLNGALGVEKNFEKAIEWYKKVAYTGDWGAINILAVFGVKP